MMIPSRVHGANAAYAPPGAGPLARECPRCGAPPGHHCRPLNALGSHIPGQTTKRVHRERRKARSHA